MRFQFIEHRFDFPALVIEGRRFLGWGLLVIQYGGEEAIDRLGVRDAIQTIVDDAHLDRICLALPILFGWVDVAQIRAVGNRSSQARWVFFLIRYSRSAPVVQPR